MPIKAKTWAQLHPASRCRPTPELRGYDAAWRRLRLVILRNDPQCTFCPHPASIVDHKVPISAGGERLNPDNLRSVCRECHDKLTANFKRTGRNEMPTPLCHNV